MPLPKIDAKMFTQISNDWGEMFPEYKKRVKGAFSKIVGPFRFSVWLDRGGWSGSDGYHPHSSISPFLIERDSMGAFLDTQPEKAGRTIRWQGHTKFKYHKKAADYLKNHGPLPMEGLVTVSQILNAYKTHSGEGGFFIEDAEAPALLCGWIGKPELAPTWVEWGREKYLDLYNRKLERREALKGTPEYDSYNMKVSLEEIDEWTEEMHQRVQDTDYLRDLVEAQIKKFKYDKFPRSDLIVDV